MQPSEVATSPQRSEARRSPALLIALLLLLAVVVGVALRMVVTDAERLDLLFDQLAEALAEEDRATMDRLLEERFSYDGPRPLGDGDRAKAFDRLDEFWAESTEIKLTARSREVVVEGSVGVISGKGHLRFSWSDTVVLYRVTFEIAALKTDDGWVAQGVRVTELAPGLF